MTTPLSDQHEDVPQSGAAGAEAVGQDRPELQRAIEEIVGLGFLGVSLRVRDQRGEWGGSAGKAELDGTAAPPTDGYARIGSTTKTFAAALVLRTVAEGVIGLDAPVAEHLPGFALDERITVRMLLQHTSGVFNFTGEFEDDGTLIPGVTTPYGATTREWLDGRLESRRPEDLVRLALSKPARFEPGAKWSYSNTNYVLARLLVESVTGRSFPEEMQRQVLGPLGLKGTILPEDSPDIPAPHAHGYFRYEKDGVQETVDITRQNPSWLCTGGDMISTTEDTAVFVAALLDGRLLPPGLVAEMCTPVSTGIPSMDYGLGVFVQKTENGTTVINHNGGVPGYAAMMTSTPDGSTTLTAAVNYVDDPDLTMSAKGQEAYQRLVREVF
ncbi:serine hydrolase domain-containing protein [Nocardiopsis suaedae]|uniref:Serine hydrolase n=1 Tax=Nocardiopsis suaedae TaxID=3018444 RepID=A0ABT4TFC2_9ACTN|nr:serine hydrolase domain-containing protein [Nocardiopsis suaedae]MDA2803383.1 serine hydrolase [Nocardiopsis suaedae]